MDFFIRHNACGFQQLSLTQPTSHHRPHQNSQSNLLSQPEQKNKRPTDEFFHDLGMLILVTYKEHSAATEEHGAVG
jgi:hypothetical protein